MIFVKNKWDGYCHSREEQSKRIIVWVCFFSPLRRCMSVMLRYVCMCVCIYVCMYVCMHACIHVFIHVCMFFSLAVFFLLIQTLTCVSGM